MYDNPLQELVPFLQAPIFANEEAFQPQISSLKEAESLFNKGHHITHHPSAVSFNHLPEHDLSEVNFIYHFSFLYPGVSYHFLKFCLFIFFRVTLGYQK